MAVVGSSSRKGGVTGWKCGYRVLAAGRARDASARGAQDVGGDEDAEAVVGNDPREREEAERSIWKESWAWGWEKERERSVGHCGSRYRDTDPHLEQSS